MYTRWTSHLTDEEDVLQFKNQIHSARDVLERLRVLLDEDLKALDRSEQDQRIYDLPNWDYRQAHKNGVRQAYAQLQTLINLDQQHDDRKSTSNGRPVRN